jgi:hypothetical protein
VGHTQEQHTAVGEDGAGLRADEAHLGTGQQPQDLVRPHGVQGSDARVEHDGDLHDEALLHVERGGAATVPSGGTPRQVG